MSLRRRGTVWWIDIRAPDGQRLRRSAGTESKTLALELHDKLKAELWRTQKLGVRPKRSWNDAVVRWLKESTHKASIESDKSQLRWLDRHLRGKDLEMISRSLTERLIEARLAEGVTNATVNRTLELVRAILRR